MAKTQQKQVTKKDVVITKTSDLDINDAGKIQINELRIVATDRTQKDIGTYRTAVVTAEAVYYPIRVKLYDLYTDILTDGYLTGIIQKRLDSVLNKKLHYNDKNGKRIDEMEDVIESDSFRHVITEILQAKLWGVSGMEFLPNEKLEIKDIPRKHIKPEKGIIAFDQYSLEDGIVYADVDNIWVIGEKRDLGLLMKVAPYSIWKRGAFGEWAQYIEIFGQPVRVIYYDAYDTKTKIELKEVLDRSGASLALMIPKQAQFEMKDGKQSNGDGQLQDKFRQACNEEMAICILGNTETTSSSKSSGYAQSKTHSQQQLEITKSDLKHVANLLNCDKFINILKSYGYPVSDGGKFEFEKEVNIEDLATRIDIDTKVAQQVPVSDDYFYETYGIPKPDNYNELKAKQEANKAAMQQQLQDSSEENEDDKPKQKGNPPIKKTKPDLKARSNFWDELRSQLADFFDPAP